MMHGLEKSDSPVVPAKSANKGGTPAAESMEGRGGTKRNTTLHAKARTQRRNRLVPSAVPHTPASQDEGCASSTCGRSRMP